MFGRLKCLTQKVSLFKTVVRTGFLNLLIVNIIIFSLHGRCVYVKKRFPLISLTAGARNFTSYFLTSS